MERHTDRFRCLILLFALLAAGCSSTPRTPGEPARSAEHAARIALDMVGTPYRYGGSSPQGFDCSGLVHYAYQQAGVAVPRTAREQRRRSTAVDHRRLRRGDLLYFDTSWRSGHVGIYVGGGEFVHAPSSGKRVVRTSLNQGYFASRLRYAGRLVGR